MGFYYFADSHKKGRVVPLYYSAVFINSNTINPYKGGAEVFLKSRLNGLLLGKIYIIKVFSVSHLHKDREEELKQEFSWDKMNLIGVSSDDDKSCFYVLSVVDSTFFKSDFFYNLAINLKENELRFIVIFYNTPLSIIKLKFLFEGYSISGGSNTFKHILSPQKILVYDFLRVTFGDEFALLLVDNSFKFCTQNRTLSRNIFNS